MYAFPPVAILGKVVEKLQDHPCLRIILIAPGWPNMPWFWDLVAMASQIPLSLPTNTALQSDSPQKSAKPKSACLTPRASAIREQGFCEAVAARIEAPQRGSTRSVYEAKWTIFTKWCLHNQVDFRAPLYSQWLTSYCTFFTTGSYNQAPLMATDQPLLTNWAIPPLKSARMKTSLFSWTVSTETDPKGGGASPPGTSLSGLTPADRAPFEPLKEASLKHLTFKTVLLALGSGKRRSEIDAWQTRTSDINQIDQSFHCSPHPAFFPGTSWPKRVQIVWPQWLYQPWPLCWIGLTGPSVQSEFCATIWTGPPTSGKS